MTCSQASLHKRVSIYLENFLTETPEVSMVFSTRKQKIYKKIILEPAFPSEEFPQSAPMVSCGQYFYAKTMTAMTCTPMSSIGLTFVIRYFHWIVQKLNLMIH